ncbi:uncharacterized protein B0P05DRAFT_290296 [Gilbertella persicaria]|uniref:Uncharacterized protein n=1 Tax=Rhizopus stolonifer TaxID=4846 RepID=A0A367KUU5_RHIST|nr:uncharacterized protein B0P05DRAFT_290296 [Gilbertella persicaria]KAI8054930.1 hypothetical protein B0P05DRAFT_290296 [Gilbertella persicaria]RCI05969.1 hypothetical protein CU098_006279 [Rhizopus stolonifer]
MTSSRSQRSFQETSSASYSRNGSFSTSESNTFQRPESPTLPPEISIQNHSSSGLSSETSSFSNHANENLSVNLLKSPHSALRSNEMNFVSPTSTIDSTHSYQPFDETASAGRIEHRPSRSKSKQPKSPHSSSNSHSTRAHHHLKTKNSHSSKHGNRTPDHLAAAIELSTTNSVSSSAPAAGMYWSHTLTYGRGPSRPLRAHTANLVGERLYVFGGCDTSVCFNSLYILDMDTMTWSKPRTANQNAPPPCRAHSCTVVERDLGSGRKSHQLYIFGGGNGPEYFQDVYVLDAELLVWSKPNIDPSTRPSKRRAHTTCLWNDKIIVIGGGDGARALDDVHMLDVSNPSSELLRWEKLQTSGTPPPARGYHTSNLVKDKLVVFGGSDGHDCFEDVYVLDLQKGKWTQIDLDRKIPRLAHTSTQVGSYVFVIGGHDGRRYSQDVLLFNLVTMSWEVRKVYGVPPNPRGYHTTVLYDSRLYVLGGYDGKNVFDDVHMLELSACAYLPQITNFEIDV